MYAVHEVNSGGWWCWMGNRGKVLSVMSVIHSSSGGNNYRYTDTYPSGHCTKAGPSVVQICMSSSSTYSYYISSTFFTHKSRDCHSKSHADGEKCSANAISGYVRYEQ